MLVQVKLLEVSIEKLEEWTERLSYVLKVE